MKRCATDGAPFEAVVPAPFGAVAFAGRDGRLENLQLLDAGAPLQASSEGLAPMIAEQLAAYFADPGFRFDLALNLRGTEFQQRVWAALRAIPSGQVRTYGEIARDLNSSARAVGGACRANPVPVVVPCHRVVAIGGPGGFAGRTDGAELQRKRWLLAHEGVRR